MFSGNAATDSGAVFQSLYDTDNLLSDDDA